MPVLADFSLGDVLLSMLVFFFLVLWFWLIITIFIDVFRDKALSGGAKALWVIGLILFSWIAVLVYLIARGSSMQQRAIEHARAQQEATREYIQQMSATGASSADELAKLKDLHDRGVLSDDEFATQKAKVIGG